MTESIRRLALRLRHHAKRLARRNAVVTRLAWGYRLRRGHADWSGFVSADPDGWRAMGREATSPRILVATSTGGYLSGAGMESLLAAALRVRGAAVDVLLCDGALTACQMCLRDWFGTERELARSGPPLCGPCHEPAQRMFETLGLPVHRYSQYLSPAEIHAARLEAGRVHLDRLAEYRHDGLSLGEHAMAGALRYYGRGDLPDDPLVEKVTRRFLEAALRTQTAVSRLLDTQRYDCVLFHHGMYVPQGVVGEVCRRRGIRVVNWHIAYRRQMFLFSHGDTYHRTVLSEGATSWESRALSTDQRDALRRYLESRRTASQDWVWFHPKPDFDVAAFCRGTGLDDRPRVGVLTSVTWDSRLHYPATAFPSMLEWVFATVRYAERRPDLQFVIRAHPAEITGASPASQRVADEVARVFPTLPANVVVVRPEHAISTYALMDTCDSVVVYNTKTGIELAARGIPIIVAGEAWIRGKGFTTDASTPGEYEHALDRLPIRRRMTAEEVDRAERYAYHFFFRHMIPVRLLEPTSDNSLYRHRLRSWRDLAVGRDRGLDVICDGILRGSDFIYPGDDAPPKENR